MQTPPSSTTLPSLARVRILSDLLRAEFTFGILGLRLFIACVAIASAMLGLVWLLGNGLSTAMLDNAKRILGGDVSITVVHVPLAPETYKALDQFGTLSDVAEMRSSATFAPSVSDEGNPKRATIELKAVDAAYPLYGDVTLGPDTPVNADFQSLLAFQEGVPGAIVEPSLLQQLDADLGDVLQIGSQEFQIRGTLAQEPDRLSAGAFMVGPRVLISFDELAGTGLTQRGSLIEYRSRIRFGPDIVPEQALSAVASLEPARGWELQSPDEAAERVREVTGRTTTFLGIAGLAAFAIGLTGAWSAASLWITRRRRSIAQYRLSGATTRTVVALHAVMLAAAGLLGLLIGLSTALFGARELLAILTEQLHLIWDPADLWWDAALVALTFILGLSGALITGLSAITRLSPIRAMRDDENDLSVVPRDVVAAGLCLLSAVSIAILGLPNPSLALVAALGFLGLSGLLTLCGFSVSRIAQRFDPQSFIGLAVQQGLSTKRSIMLRTVALGIGIAGITGIIATQSALQSTFEGELPERAPDIVLLDVQQDQVRRIRETVAATRGLDGLQATPFMRTRLLEVNGQPVDAALVNPEKDWVINGDRSFSWAAQPTGAELLAGQWWPEDYAGPPLVSAEEDVMEAFELKVGDTLTYSVFGRVFTSEVANIRKEYHRTMRPEFLVVASPEPFRNAPHGWVVSLRAETDALNDFRTLLTSDMPNVTIIDVRRLVVEAAGLVQGAILGTLFIAAILLLLGSMSLAASVSADVDARRREAIALSLVGATRREVFWARLMENAMTGLVAASIGGAAGLLGSWGITTGAIRIEWAPGLVSLILPLTLGILTSVIAGVAGGMGALPRQRGQLARLLSA